MDKKSHEITGNWNNNWARNMLKKRVSELEEKVMLLEAENTTLKDDIITIKARIGII